MLDFMSMAKCNDLLISTVDCGTVVTKCARVFVEIRELMFVVVVVL